MDELTVYTSASDGFASAQSNVSFQYVHDMAFYNINYTATGITVGTSRSSQTWYIRRGFLFFDTSALTSDAVISAVTLSLYIADHTHSGGYFDIVIQNGQPNYPHDPLELGDYLYSHYSGDGGSVDSETLVTNAYNDITLNSTGRGWINKTGTTKFCLRSSHDIDEVEIDEGTYSGIGFHTFEWGSAHRPKLVIAYYVPTVTTYAPTDFLRSDPTKVTARGLTEVPLDITTRGFKYGLTETDTWSESETGTFSEGAFSLQLTGLTGDTTYYIRAYMVGAWGTKYGSYLEFKTAYPYGSFKTAIEAEAIASASDIAAVGGKRSLTIENHLIQNQTIADLISAAYLADYKDQKTKLVVTKPTPAPYEIGDTIERISAKLPYYAAGSALISYAAAASALYYYNLAGKNVLIRKINVSFSAGNYVSVIELED